MTPRSVSLLLIIMVLSTQTCPLRHVRNAQSAISGPNDVTIRPDGLSVVSRCALSRCVGWIWSKQIRGVGG